MSIQAKSPSPKKKSNAARIAHLVSSLIALNLVFAMGLLSAAGWRPSSASTKKLAILPAAVAQPATVQGSVELESGESLQALLQKAELAEQDQERFIDVIRKNVDPRHLRPGLSLRFTKAFLDNNLREASMGLDPDRILHVYASQGEWRDSVEVVPVKVDTLVVSGQIQNTLYETILKLDNDVYAGMTADERRAIVDVLADEIFARQIDFSRDIRNGDQFHVVYERLVRPDGSARAGKVMGVQFRVMGRLHEAYRFAFPDGKEEFYDKDGESLRQGFLRAPLEYRRITSTFKRSRYHPVLKKNRPHNGIDYAAPQGTPIRAVGDATVAFAGVQGGYGNLVELQHAKGYSSRYAHMSRFGRGIRRGVRVRQGQVIGYVGSTGLSTGPHLHYEFHLRGRPVNPAGVKSIRGEPLPSRYKGAFKSRVARQLTMIREAVREMELAAEAKSDSTALED